MGHGKYNYYKIFHYPDKLEAIKRGVLTPPIHIRLKPTNVCNHNCYYCSYRVSNLSLGEDMNDRESLSRDKMLELCRDFKNMGIKAVTLSGGGEPLCYKHIAELIKNLHEIGIKIGINTNGTLIKGRLAEVIARCCTWVRISVDGWDNDSYAKYRDCSKTAYEGLLDNVKELKGLTQSCTIGLNLVIDHENYTHMQKIIHDFKSAGADIVKISECIVSNDGVENNLYHKPIFDKVKEQINHLKRLYNDGKFSIVDKYHDLPLKFFKDYNKCLFMNYLVVIGADANVYSCHDKAYTKKGIIGSIKDVSFKELWSHTETLNKINSINPSIDCNHHCGEDMKNRLLHDYLAVEPSHCEFV